MPNKRGPFAGGRWRRGGGTARDAARVAGGTTGGTADATTHRAADGAGNGAGTPGRPPLPDTREMLLDTFDLRELTGDDWRMVNHGDFVVHPPSTPRALRDPSAVTHVRMFALRDGSRRLRTQAKPLPAGETAHRWLSAIADTEVAGLTRAAVTASALPLGATGAEEWAAERWTAPSADKRRPHRHVVVVAWVRRGVVNALAASAASAPFSAEEVTAVVRRQTTRIDLALDGGSHPPD